jgi:cytochrome c
MSRRNGVLGTLGMLGIWMALALASGCEDRNAAAAKMTGGDPSQGVGTIRKYGCNSCHDIPGVEGVHGVVGPPLSGIAERVYLAGHLENTPANMMRWIRDPQSVSPGTAMPELGVTEQDSRDIAAYLYTLR